MAGRLPSPVDLGQQNRLFCRGRAAISVNVVLDRCPSRRGVRLLNAKTGSTRTQGLDHAGPGPRMPTNRPESAIVREMLAGGPVHAYRAKNGPLYSCLCYPYRCSVARIGARL